MKKKLVTVLLTCSMVTSLLCACGEEEESSRKKDRDKTETVDEEDEGKKKDEDKRVEKAEKQSVLEGTEWEEEPWTYDPWTGTSVAVTLPTPELTPEPEPGPWPVEPEPIPEPEPTSEPPVEPIEAIDVTPVIYIDPVTGKPYDFGGMEIIVRDWWSNPDTEPMNIYEEAREEYIDWLEATYNFSIKQMAISDWSSTPKDFVDYVITGGDDFNYVFVLREDPATSAALKQGLMYDLSTLDCLDFTEEKFQRNKAHEQYSYGDAFYGVYTDYAEPRTGIYFNKRVLEEAGIDPESIYDMQADGSWTWNKWTEIMEAVQRDVDNDGVIDVYGFDTNYSLVINAAVYSNDAEYVGMEGGKYVYKLEDEATIEALEWTNDCLANYALKTPSNVQWDYYKEAFLNGKCAFMVEDAYCGEDDGWLTWDMQDEVGFVAFPKGPRAEDYTNVSICNPAVIPSCYDAEKAWKIAFAYDLFTEEVPGFEGYVDMSRYTNGIFDNRALDETLPLMMDKSIVAYHGMVPNLDIYGPFLWKFTNTGVVVSDLIENVRASYQTWIDEANR